MMSDKPGPTPKWQPLSYTVATVAALWGVSDTFVYDEINRGRLKAFKLGNKLLRIRPEWIAEYEKAQELELAPAQPAPEITADATFSPGRLRRGRRLHSPASFTHKRKGKS